jgi:hypothetical protein
MTATKSKRQEAADMKTDLPIETRLQAARTALHLALLSGEPGTAALRQTVRGIEAEAQRLADEQGAAEVAKRAAMASVEAERESRIREATRELGAARRARFAAIRTGLVPTGLPSFI